MFIRERVRPLWNRDPVACLFTRHAGLFDHAALTNEKRLNYSDKRHYFWIGEVGMAGMLAGSIAVPAGIWFAEQTEISLAFIGAAVLFLHLFVFMPKLIQCAMKADADAVIDAFGKNDQVKKVFWTLFVAMAGADAGTGCGHGDNSADCWEDYGMGG